MQLHILILDTIAMTTAHNKQISSGQYVYRLRSDVYLVFFFICTIFRMTNVQCSYTLIVHWNESKLDF